MFYILLKSNLYVEDNVKILPSMPYACSFYLKLKNFISIYCKKKKKKNYSYERKYTFVKTWLVPTYHNLHELPEYTLLQHECMLFKGTIIVQP